MRLGPQPPDQQLGMQQGIQDLGPQPLEQQQLEMPQCQLLFESPPPLAFMESWHHWRLMGAHQWSTMGAQCCFHPPASPGGTRGFVLRGAQPTTTRRMPGPAVWRPALWLPLQRLLRRPLSLQRKTLHERALLRPRHRQSRATQLRRKPRSFWTSRHLRSGSHDEMSSWLGEWR